MAIGMSVPGLSAAGSALGLGNQETEEERRRRLAAMASSQQRLSGALVDASGGFSPAGQSLFG